MGYARHKELDAYPDGAPGAHGKHGIVRPREVLHRGPKGHGGKRIRRSLAAPGPSGQSGEVRVTRLGGAELEQLQRTRTIVGAKTVAGIVRAALPDTVRMVRSLHGLRHYGDTRPAVAVFVTSDKRGAAVTANRCFGPERFAELVTLLEVAGVEKWWIVRRYNDLFVTVVRPVEEGES